MKKILRALLAIAATSLVVPALAESQLYKLDIARQSLKATLTELGKQTGLQVGFLARTKEEESMLVGPLKGQYTIESALEEILAESGLTFTRVNEITIAVTALGAERSVRYERNGRPTFLRAVDQQFEDEPVRSENFRPIGSSNEEADGPIDAAGASDKSVEPRRRVENLEEIIVTGTHIRGAPELPMPIIRLTRADIDTSGYSRVEDLFRSLPQNFAEISPTVGEGASTIASENVEQVTGIDLRGLGPQSTLVLLNGQRRAGSVQGRVVDISAIPLSVVERVEVVTGGRSAIYGSDAVAGVVNLVTRRDFEGAETSAYYGAAEPGAERLQVSQIFGRRTDGGGFVAAYDYSEGSSLDATDAGIVRLPTVFGIVPTPGEFYLLPDDTRHSVFLSGEHAVGKRVRVYADGLYTSDERDTTIGYSAFGFDVFQRTHIENDQYSFSPGIELALSETWTLDISGVHSKAESENSWESTFGPGTSGTESALSSVSAVADGAVLSSQSVDIRTAVGIESRWEDIKSITLALDDDRTIRSAFAEALISLWPSEAGGHRLRLSLAGRYSDYSDFGASFDPQFGVSWDAGAGLTLRGAYSTAFRAPDLFSLNDAFGTGAILIDQSDPMQAGAPVPTLILLGKNAALEPEEAKTWSLGFDYRPEFAPGMELSVSYFDIQYDERIDEPANGTDRFVALMNEGRYPGLIDRSPTAAELEDILARSLTQGGFGNNTAVPFDPATQTLLEAFPNLILFDNRVHNVAVENMSGLDVTLASRFDVPFGALSLGLNGVYYVDFERRLTPQSPAFSELNAPSKPVDFRLRANVGWTRSAFGAFVYVNYVDDYTDTLTTPMRKISSWTTVDTTLRFDGSEVSDGFLRGFTATLGVVNLLDKEPPVFRTNTLGIGFDPANSNALGRFVSLGVAKKW